MDEIISLAASLLLKLTLAGVGALLSAYIIPLLEEKKLYHILQKLVSAAEKLAQSSAIDKSDKKAYVIARLQDYGIEVNQFVDALIEAAVLELDTYLGRGHDAATKKDEIGITSQNEVTDQ